MKKAGLCLFIFSCILTYISKAQDCSALQFTYATAPSRCMATGSIEISMTGGSGNYNYRVIGPVTTPYTSSSVITGLQAGTYTLLVKDVATGCIVGKDDVVVGGSYSDPRFFLSKTDVTCKGNDGSITVYGLEEGRSPFLFSIVAPSPSGVGTSNVTGNFGGLAPGEYSIQLRDSCGGIQVRRITIENFAWVFNKAEIVKVGCDSADLRVLLNDNRGNTNLSNPAFSGFSYGVVRAPGDTTWFNNPAFRIRLTNKYTITAVIKDPCGNVGTFTQPLPAGSIPEAGPVNTGSFTCSTFRAAVSGQQHLTDPRYCLYNAANVLLGCNASGVFDNIPYGDYCIRIYDDCFDTTIVRCFTGNQPLPAAGGVVISNENCTGFTASIAGAINLTNAQFCVYDSGNMLVACNSSGVFNMLPYGSYCMQIRDGCYDTTITKCFSASRPVPAIQSVNVVSDSCNAFDVDVISNTDSGTLYCLYDQAGNLIGCTTDGVFNDIPQGQYCVRGVTTCGDTTAPVCFATQSPQPYVGENVRISDRACNTFTAAITGQTNVTAPEYCLYNAANVLIGCNATGIFTGLPYGTYCIQVTDGCYDTTIQRCFSAIRPEVTLTAKMEQSDKTCNTFKLTVTGTNFTTPQYCLFNGQGVQVACNSTGIFTNLPYDDYCAKITDGCIDTTVTICQSFAKLRGLTLTTYKVCTIGNGMVAAQAKSVNNPFTFTYYHPDGSVLHTINTWSGYVSRELPVLAPGNQYKVVVVDNCGNRDSAFIAPDATIISKQVNAISKCPGGSWPDGSGDLVVVCTSNLFKVNPLLIQKDGAPFNKNYSNTNWQDTYTFTDLGPGTYVIEYTLDQCMSKAYDTFRLRPYEFPSNGQSAIYQCDNSGFSVGGNVTGGIGPFQYEIIGSVPAGLALPPQPSPVFNINNGTTYSLVRLRCIDACGNASLSDVSVLPLQNIVITANSTCLYRSVTLSVDTIPNATYAWYKKTGPGDSVWLGNEAAWHVPYMAETDMGTYMCKVKVNDECLTRVANFTFDGQCNDVPLPAPLLLRSRIVESGNQLDWSKPGADYTEYSVERRTDQAANFVEIARLKGQTADKITYTDREPARGSNAYRVLAIAKSGQITVSNTVIITGGTFHVTVSPNPAEESFYVSMQGETAGSYLLELVNISGRVISRKEIQAGNGARIPFHRNSLPAGIYAIKIRHSQSGTTRIFKVQFR